MSTRHDDTGGTDVPDVVIWEADGTIDGHRGHGHLVSKRLARTGWNVVTVPLTRRAPGPTELDAAVHVITGGYTPVHGDPQWLARARAALDRALPRGLDGSASITGICFGAQLIASRIAGARAVGAHPGGMQAGLVEIDTDRGSDGPVSSFHYHRIDDTVLERAGATVVATSTGTAVQAFEAGAGVRGVQFHPEINPAALGIALPRHRAMIAREGASLAESLASIRTRRHTWSDALWRRFVVDPAANHIEPLVAAA